MTTPVALRLPLAGRALVQNSPARRVPSHGTDLFATTYGIDLVPVDEHGSRGPRDWRTLLATEPPERYVGFGAPVLAPSAGTVVAAHDAEADHEGRRSQPALVVYLLGQAKRARAGWVGLAGNHVVIRLPEGSYVAIAHLQHGSLRVRVGDRVEMGDPVAACGNSGNSTEPHVHLQVMDSADPATARGLPLAFVDFRADQQHEPARRPWHPGRAGDRPACGERLTRPPRACVPR